MAIPKQPKINPDLNNPSEVENVAVDESLLEQSGESEEDLILKQARQASQNNENGDGLFYEIQSDELMSGDPSYYAKFDKIVEETIGYVQKNMQDRGEQETIAEGRMHGGAELQKAKREVHSIALGYLLNKNLARGKDAEVISSLVVNEITGLGPIEPLWQNPDITEIMVNGHDRVRVEIKGKLYTVKGARFRDDKHLLETCKMILSPIGRDVNTAHPYEDGRLRDGSRINVTDPSIGNGNTFLTVRRFRQQAFSMKDLVDKGSMPEEIALFIGNMINKGLSCLVAGPTGAGKTSLLNALSGCIPETERVITIEDNIEMTLNPSKDIVALEARKSGRDGQGGVSIRDLVRNALRMRPDRIIVGEVRDGSAYDMLQAMNTGHDGSMTTVHANDAYGAVDRIINLISEVGEVDTNRALSLVAGGVDLIVCIDRYEDGSRRVSQLAEIPNRVSVKDGVASLEPRILWEFVQTGRDKDDFVVGEYKKVHELSESLVKQKRINNKDELTLEQIYAISEHK
jgi:pilus assembly protein CpaF